MEQNMAFLQTRTKTYISRLIVTAHLLALIVCATCIYIAWDGGEVIRQAIDAKAVSVYSYYFGDMVEPGWAPQVYSLELAV
jgi:hypothetical protein